VGYSEDVSDSAFEYGAVSAERFAMWEDILKDVGFARGYGPAHGKPGFEDYQLKATQALEQLWTHLALLPRLVDESHPHVAAYLKSVRRTVEREAPPPPRKRWMDAGLDLSHVMNTLEALLLGLIGPQGQSPHPPCSAEIPTQPYFEAWLALRAGSPDLLPGPAARRVVSWRTERAVVGPKDAKEIVDRKPRAVTIDECRALIDDWNRRSTTQRYLGPSDASERVRYEEWQDRFEEVYAQLTADLKRFSERGELYIGWTAWYGHE
jgi:hypothetical protein